MGVELKQILELDEANFQRVVGWMHAWWGQQEGYSPDALRCWLQSSLQKDRLPMTFGLFEDNAIVGMYQFVNDDLFVRPDIYPWLANVYVDEQCRGRGYSRILLESVAGNFPKHLGYKHLFLFTKHVGLYERYGWEYAGPIDTFQNKDRIQRLYRLAL